MKIIQFIPKTGMDANAIPAKNSIPEWYRKSEIFLSTGEAGLKTCIAFLDTLTSGYLLTTWEDIHVKTVDGEITITGYKNGVAFENDESVIGIRDHESGALIPRPVGHTEHHLIWKNPMGFKLPRGYSALITHPLNRFDLPFTTMSGIIDSDKWWLEGNISFCMKDNVDVFIPKGTPFAQLIPIKRKKWVHSVGGSVLVKLNLRKVKIDRSKVGFYKKNMWKRKSYL
jgi:hypothetical protein